MSGDSCLSALGQLSSSQLISDPVTYGRAWRDMVDHNARAPVIAVDAKERDLEPLNR